MKASTAYNLCGSTNFSIMTIPVLTSNACDKPLDNSFDHEAHTRKAKQPEASPL